MDNRTSEYVNSVFEQPWWLDVVATNTWKEILLREEGKVIARWPIVIKGNQIKMPKMTQSLGFWLSKSKISNDIHYNERKRITNSLLDQLPGPKSINIRLNPSVDYFLPMYWRHYTINPCLSFRFNDLSSVEKIYEKFNNNVKRYIKSAGEKMSVRSIDDIEVLLKLVDKTFALQNRKNPFSKVLIREIYTACKVHNAGRLLYALDKDGNPQSGALFVYDKNVCYYWLAGTNPEYRSTGINSLLIWEGIKFASTVSRSFDFEGSMVEGIENFFRQFGATPTVYYHIRKQNIVLEIMELLKPGIKSLIGYKQ